MQVILTKDATQTWNASQVVNLFLEFLNENLAALFMNYTLMPVNNLCRTFMWKINSTIPYLSGLHVDPLLQIGRDLTVGVQDP